MAGPDSQLEPLRRSLKSAGICPTFHRWESLDLSCAISCTHICHQKKCRDLVVPPRSEQGFQRRNKTTTCKKNPQTSSIFASYLFLVQFLRAELRY
ncbi:potassium channel tetramerization domain containing 2 [Columba livia]|uniref:Potassium channel tetramerization domain containing 2 n=1 Tax=Columba livia TaxID=8932 RepID=A0A2I0M780_COLLI|nr:potassium channel tetramerization domain containing 2 [Columba livia]